jgi:hypothetical protein
MTPHDDDRPEEPDGEEVPPESPARGVIEDGPDDEEAPEPSEPA